MENHFPTVIPNIDITSWKIKDNESKFLIGDNTTTYEIILDDYL
jgi:hypothetical protein